MVIVSVDVTTMVDGPELLAVVAAVAVVVVVAVVDIIPILLHFFPVGGE